VCSGLNLGGLPLIDFAATSLLGGGVLGPWAARRFVVSSAAGIEFH
jgi:hypothetical protein